MLDVHTVHVTIKNNIVHYRPAVFIEHRGMYKTGNKTSIETQKLRHIGHPRIHQQNEQLHRLTTSINFRKIKIFP